MAKNYVEQYTQAGAFHSFKVEEGQTVKIGQLVEITPNGKVQVAGAGSIKVLGTVYSGTTGKDGRNVGYEGDKGEVATVVVLKPLVYLEASGTVTAGDSLKAGVNGTVVTHSSGTTFVQDEYKQVVAMALASGTTGERVLSILV